MKTYTIISGVNGVGKSSLTGALKPAKKDLGEIIDIDKLAQEEQLSNLDAGKLAIGRMNDFVEKGISFTQETTLSGHFVEKMVQKARENGYKIRMYYIGLDSAEESMLRIKNRVQKGGHNISDGDVTKRFANRFEDLIKLLPYCDEVEVYSNENGFVNVADYINGELVHKSKEYPEWVNELEQAVQKSKLEYMPNYKKKGKGKEITR